MVRVCPKCGYERKADEPVPETECPQCGAIYAKIEQALRKAEDPEPQNPDPQEPQPDKDEPPSVEEKKRQVDSISLRAKPVEPGKDTNLWASDNRYSQLIFWDRTVLCLLESVWSAHHHRQSYRYSGQRRLDHRFCGQTHCLGYCCGRGNFTVFIFMVPEYPPIIKGVKFFLRPRYYRNYISSSHFLARPMAMAICPGVIFFSMMSVFFFPTSLPFTPAMLNHLWAST